MKYSCFAFILLLISLNACQKDTTIVKPKVNTQSNNTCSAIASPQDTVIINGRKYFIIASLGSSNVIAIELINDSAIYPVNLSMEFLQAINTGNCYESSDVTVLTASQYKTYSFGSFPSWANDTNTTCIIKLQANSNSYYLRDTKLNK